MNTNLYGIIFFCILLNVISIGNDSGIWHIKSLDYPALRSSGWNPLGLKPEISTSSNQMIETDSLIS